MVSCRFKIGDIVQHFKYQYNTKEERAKLIYVYEIVAFATDADTGENCVVYRSLYSKNIWVRKLGEFLSEVDHSKYPDIKQKYRFECYRGELQ